ncbi:coiled-coil domain-containing protein 50 isoform X1 [Tachysurus fulvidraco]|uniref:coiled-coil domain-containing protein 50 isoform X1 n=1 Tax=Tachysurus fulvidraco TaxID=1234273 RepID=UPI001FEE27FB|nr:coiled-coil domain-containing protein 50 isoform X1 [Tachysurus fulvidraco]
MEDFSIDQKKLPGVKEVCREFAVLEDHCLAHNLQEQEIESHLASNIHKSRLVRQDLRVAKRLQEEEDQRAKVQSQKQHHEIERSDNEIAQEIQEQLVRQAEKQKQQEAKDEAIARKLQEREMKEERKRQKQLEAKLEEQYYEDKGAYRPPSDPRLEYLDTDLPASGRERYRETSRGQSPDRRLHKLEPNRRLDSYQEYDPVEGDPSRVSEQNRGKNEGKPRRQVAEHHLSEVRTKYPEEYLAGRNRHAEAELRYQDPAFTMKERAYRDDPYDRDRARRRDRDQERERDRRKKGDKPQYRDKSQERANKDLGRDRLLNKEADFGQNGYRHKSRDRDLDLEIDKPGRKERVRDGERHRSRDGSRGRELAGRFSEETEENADYIKRQGIYSSDEVFEEPSSRSLSKGHSPRYRGRSAQEEYGVREAVHGLSQIDLRAQEIKDLEVARILQEQELKASKLDKRAAQVAQDEEIARRIMEEEEREYKKSREKERQQRKAEGDSRPVEEEMARPRTREEYDYQKARNPKPSRPPPHIHDYVNVDPGYDYSDNYHPRPPSRPEAAYKGAYYRQ